MTRFSASIVRKLRQEFPAGSPVIVVEQSKTGRGIFATTETVGTVIEWRHEPAGAWYSPKGDPSTLNADGKLQLLRLRLRKVDGEMTDLVIDDLTTLAKLEAQ
jgi:hypothetical protein